MSCFGLTISLFVSSFSDFGRLNILITLSTLRFLFFVHSSSLSRLSFSYKSILVLFERILFFCGVFTLFSFDSSLSFLEYGENRIEYWSLFPLGNLGSYLNFFYYISIFTCFYASRPLFIFIVSLLIVFLAGERVTGLCDYYASSHKAKTGISWRQTGLIHSYCYH